MVFGGGLMMKVLGFVVFLFFVVQSFCFARVWTDLKGRKIEAEVVEVFPNKTVKLKRKDGKKMTVPFSMFAEKDVVYLEGVLKKGSGGAQDKMDWKKVDACFGFSLWGDDLLWDDSTAEVAKRMKLRKESKTEFLENYRSYPFGRLKILGEPVFAVALYGGSHAVESISFVFINQGDIPAIQNINKKKLSQMVEKKIHTSGKHLRDVLTARFGKPKRDSLGRGKMREKVWRWDWNTHAIMLSVQEKKYVALRIMPVEIADRGGKMGKIRAKELKNQLAHCVERRENGDVFIKNVPMINQGPKGYCSPATWERYLRYMHIPADMYLLALAADTGVGGGTYSAEMMEAVKPLVTGNGRALKEIGSDPSIRLISRYVDQGLPIFWRLISTPSFQQAVNNNTARRLGKPIKKTIVAGQAEDSQSGGHICLIVGYNKKTKEVAISDSWGSRFLERWVSIDEIKKASNGTMVVIKW